MERITRIRVGWVLLIFAVILGIFALTLYDLQIIQTGGNIDNSSTFTTRTRVKAARGNILDRNGKVLVSNRATFDLVLNHYVLISAEGTNEYLYKLVKQCEELGIEYTEHFPVSKERPFVYTLDEYNSSWQNNFQKYIAFMGKIDSDITAPLLIETLRTRYKIPASWTDTEARQVIGLRYELDLRRCVYNLSNFVVLSDASDEAQAAILELNIPGLQVENSVVRQYHTEYAAHILGHIGAVTPAQWEYYKDIDGYEMDALVGQSGIELAFEEYLHGIDGWREDVVAKDGTLISSRYLVEPKAGSNVELTIDITLQGVAEETLNTLLNELRLSGDAGKDAEGGAVVAIDPKTGQVLVCASNPTYDLSTYFENYEQLKDADFNPLFNRALNGLYAPGSTYKMSTLIAGFESQLYNAQSIIVDKGVFTKYAGFHANCLKWTNQHQTHGAINAAEALQYSCNYFFYEMGDNITLEAMDSTAAALGLGVKTGVELSEQAGYRANAATKELLHTGDNKYWYKGNQILAAIGQDDNQFTPIQLCNYAATLANQGTRYKATFLKRVISSDFSNVISENQVQIADHLDISDETYETYLDGMLRVTSVSGGTAYSVFRDYPVEVAGKTGTAQIGNGMPANGSFVCFAPARDPQIAMSVYGEKTASGAQMSKVAKAVLDKFFEIGSLGSSDVFENQLG
ncbi:MAG: hypothetical protein IJD63_02480 [Oscillospiraceae bacterium]|nr:hypothetical protein [Oscillospiraceae bacterium]